MPIYGVRWDDMTLSVIEAYSKEDLFWKIDDRGPPAEVSFKKLTNPLYLNLKTATPIQKVPPEPIDARTLAAQKMTQLMTDEEFCDVLVYVQNGSKTFKCHKCVLATCAYFRHLLTSQNKEGDSSILNLMDVSGEVFAAVREFLYLCEISDWSEREKSLTLLYELLQFSYSIGLTDLRDKVLEKIVQYLERSGWDSYYKIVSVQGVGEIVSGIDLATSLQLDDFTEKLTKWLFEKIEYQNKNKIPFDILAEVEKVDMILANKLKTQLANAEKVRLVSKELDEVICNLQSMSYLRCVQDFLENISTAKLINFVNFCPYHRLVSKIIDLNSSTKAIKNNACRVIKMLRGVGFPVNEKSGEKVDSLPGSCGPIYVSLSSGALFLAARHGEVELVKTLLEVGANPLKSHCDDGATIIHDIYEQLASTLTEFGVKAHGVENQPHISDKLRNNMQEALHMMMKKVQCKDIFELPYANPEEFEVAPKYVDSLVDEVAEGHLRVHFNIDEEPYSDRCSECVLELSEVLHPRLIDIAKECGNAKTPFHRSSSEFEKLKDRIKKGIKKEKYEATRFLVKYGQLKKITDPWYTTDEDMDYSSDEQLL